MLDLDITRQNVAVEQLLDQTTNPRHRYLLQSYLRHRYLESAGRYQEILAPELTVDNPVYRFSLIGREPFVLQGREQVEMLYRHWTQTDQCVFYVKDETVAGGIDADPEAMYLSTSRIAMIWPYDDRCRLLGEDVWEFEPGREYLKLDPGDVLTAKQAGDLLAPFIKPLPPFDDSLLPGLVAVTA
jgi:hypothetical protein